VPNCAQFAALNCNTNWVFYVYGSAHRWSTLIIVQRDATQSSLFCILQVHSTCFGCQPHPISAVNKTVTTASGTGHIFSAVTSLQRGQASLTWPVPEAVVTVFCTPDDGCDWHPKHVEWTCRIQNRLICVASRWTIINTNWVYSGALYHILAKWLPHCRLVANRQKH